jgi:hypothetical protein
MLLVSGPWYAWSTRRKAKAMKLPREEKREGGKKESSSLSPPLLLSVPSPPLWARFSFPKMRWASPQCVLSRPKIQWPEFGSYTQSAAGYVFIEIHLLRGFIGGKRLTRKTFRTTCWRWGNRRKFATTTKRLKTCLADSTSSYRLFARLKEEVPLSLKHFASVVQGEGAEEDNLDSVWLRIVKTR